MLKKFIYSFIQNQKTIGNTVEALHNAIKSNNMQQVQNIAVHLSPQDIADLVGNIAVCWYGLRQYNNILPILGKYIRKTDGWYEPILKNLRDGKAENNLNGWLGTSQVISVTQILGREFVPEILAIIEGSYCDPAHDYIGRDGAAEMMVMLFPFMPINLRENWLTMTIESINSADQLDDKAIAIANLCDHLANEDEKRRLVKEAVLALKKNSENYPNENSHAIALLKKKAPSDMMDEILQL